MLLIVRQHDRQKYNATRIELNIISPPKKLKAIIFSARFQFIIVFIFVFSLRCSTRAQYLMLFLIVMFVVVIIRTQTILDWSYTALVVGYDPAPIQHFAVINNNRNVNVAATVTGAVWISLNRHQLN